MGGEGVADIMKSDVRQSSIGQQGFELLVGSTGIYRKFWAERVMENPWGAGLALPFAENLCRAGRQDDLPRSRIGFGVTCGKRFAFLFVKSAAHMERTLFCIEILPPQCADLASAQADGHCGVEEIMPEFIFFDCSHEGIQLCFGQDLHGRAVKFGRIHFCGRVDWN